MLQHMRWSQLAQVADSCRNDAEKSAAAKLLNLCKNKSAGKKALADKVNRLLFYLKKMVSKDDITNK